MSQGVVLDADKLEEILGGHEVWWRGLLLPFGGAVGSSDLVFEEGDLGVSDWVRLLEGEEAVLKVVVSTLEHTPVPIVFDPGCLAVWCPHVLNLNVSEDLFDIIDDGSNNGPLISLLSYNLRQ